MNLVTKKAMCIDAKKVHLIHDGITIDLGLLNREEQDQLALELMSAVWDLSPSVQSEAVAWLYVLISKLGIEL